MIKQILLLGAVMLTACATPPENSKNQAISCQSTANEESLRARNLISDDPAWPLLQEWIAAASNRVEVLPADDLNRCKALDETRVTTRSTMGALIYETGGILIDGGWLRILGSGHPRLPRTLPNWSKERGIWKDEASSPPLLIIADDALGGSFAINGGALEGQLGGVYYFAPDSLRWESLDRGYSDFLQWAFQGDLNEFYKGQRWSNWSQDVAALPGDKVFTIYPFLWAKGPPIEKRARNVVPMAELFDLQFDILRQVSEAPSTE